MKSDHIAAKHKHPSQPASAPIAPPRRAGESAILCAGVALAGAAVMVIELLGTRVLAPVFGNSLYVWTALISVTLFALTIGYPLGGAVADRYPASRVFFGALAASGLAVLLTLVVRAPVLSMASSWGPRAGTLGAGLLLFMPPLVLLGMVGPFASRLFVREVRRVGLTVGSISAISAGGSIVGSILTGFVLIPQFGISKILLTLGISLIVIALVGLAWTRATAAAGAVHVIALGLGALLYFVDRAPAAIDPRINVMYEGSSAYGDVKVVEVPWRGSDGAPCPARLMFLGQTIQTVDTPKDAYLTVSDSAYLIPSLRPDTKKILIVGLGGGTKVGLMNALGIAVDSVEIDPLVIQQARKHFRIQDTPLSRVIEADGRPYLNRCTEKYDAIYVDAFGGGIAPPHLFSFEAFTAMKRCLKPNGLLMMNCMRSVPPPEDALLPDVLKTLAAENLFHNRRLYVWDPNPNIDTIQNFVVLASDGSLETTKPLDRIVSPERAARLLEKLLPRPVEDAGGTVVTDDLNPLDLLQVKHNERLLKEAVEGGFKQLFDPRRY